MIVPKLTLTKVEKGKFQEILEIISKSKFSGYVRVGFKKGELSLGEIIFENGKPIIAEVSKLKSKTSISGDAAIRELENLEYVVAEIYTMTTDQLRKVVEMNRGLEVKEAKVEIDTKVKPEKKALYEKYGIKPPEEWEIQKIIRDSLENSEFFSEIEKHDSLAKYGIKRPREEEIDAIISNVLGEYEEEEIKPEFEALKAEIVETISSRLGKAAKKAVDMVKSCKSERDLIQNAGAIGKTLKSLTVFVPKKKVEEVIAEIEKRIGQKIV